VTSYDGVMRRGVTWRDLACWLEQAIGSVLAPILADDGNHMGRLMVVMAIPSSIGAVLTTLLLQDKPPTPPSASAAEKSDPFFVGLVVHIAVTLARLHLARKHECTSAYIHFNVSTLFSTRSRLQCHTHSHVHTFFALHTTTSSSQLLRCALHRFHLPLQFDRFHAACCFLLLRRASHTPG
jgi:hypothetical protein